MMTRESILAQVNKEMEALKKSGAKVPNKIKNPAPYKSYSGDKKATKKK